MLRISNKVFIPDNEIEITAVRAKGAGGQNVNKVSSAVHLRFDIRKSSLPPFYKNRLLHMKDNRITKQGIIVIKAQEHRSQEQNREEALNRLQRIVQRAAVVRKKRKPTRPSRTARQKRLDKKKKRSQIKALRSKVKE